MKVKHDGITRRPEKITIQSNDNVIEKVPAINKITIQSMTCTKTDDIAATVGQINRLAAIGCDIIRVAVPDMAGADAIGKIKEQITIPLVADIHFDHKLALRAIEAGADKYVSIPEISTRKLPEEAAKK